MAKVKITRAELNKLLKEQLGIENITFDKNGNAEIEIDFCKLKNLNIPHHVYNPFKFPDRKPYDPPYVVFGTGTPLPITDPVTCGSKLETGTHD